MMKSRSDDGVRDYHPIYRVITTHVVYKDTMSLYAGHRKPPSNNARPCPREIMQMVMNNKREPWITF
ncbi:MAG: hypothetical protein BWY09_02557 [Candidatus Hydrogenedentes bacterium ADurb.Bin179]|nr:MAG: hypothetical protein BWY09_02557 [Candidatus Hydrogenedentes bacterium ADurb.Bin179]